MPDNSDLLDPLATCITLQQEVFKKNKKEKDLM